MNTTRLKRWPRPLDAVIIIIAVLVIVLISIEVYGGKGSAARLLVQSEGRTFVYPLDQDRIIEVKGPLGTTTIEIRDGRARFVDSPCRDKICVAYGWLENPGEWTACLPNKVLAAIEDNSSKEASIDFLSY
ncbi:NusG domain II-containing protein [Sediminispirochaeta bajacaliforniensis]|uniref:NusG domain II-containing protein n=1 Tax=Sediminispirochaeta bajacaliforniensis TaxID=148 RepID=UPI0003603B36|nr:NusG domain II-containing protein [Sediminispirochaeta bajacaliforniensis]